ncbi:hypothetical protein FWC63_01805 [Candidatus Saccharibacteria bacterium]|nr:hypothetical protein [Candidatus Saccharibacteria bacterium]
MLDRRNSSKGLFLLIAALLFAALFIVFMLQIQTHTHNERSQPQPTTNGSQTATHNTTETSPPTTTAEAPTPPPATSPDEPANGGPTEVNSEPPIESEEYRPEPEVADSAPPEYYPFVLYGEVQLIVQSENFGFSTVIIASPSATASTLFIFEISSPLLSAANLSVNDIVQVTITPYAIQVGQFFHLSNPAQAISRIE